MDPRQSISRTSSSNVPPSTYQPNNMATSYSMPPYQGGTHLPPINYQGMPPSNQPSYVPQQPYRNDVQQRYPPGSAPPSAPPPDRYSQHMTPPTSMQPGLPPASMLPQPQGHPTPPQNYQQHPPQQQQTRQNYQPALAPAPPRSALDPPASNYGHPAWSGPEGIPGMTSDVGRDPTRTHVVGSQGRRGILPSAPGRPPVSANGLNGSPKAGQIPQKDADGKFPCPNCTKTYLHAKHLKRHMLRHTGDRPYMCVLCNDTFSRSDILKRHFQKCSVRRGNPTGASHLSNPAAHLKKSQAAAAKAAANAAATAGTTTPPGGHTPTSSSLPGAPYTSTSLPPNSIPTTAGGPPTSMSYSMTTPAQADMQRPQSTAQGQVDPNGNDQWAMHDARAQPMMYHHGSAPAGHFAMQNQGGDDKRVAMPNAHMGDDWNHMFPPGANEQYMNPVFSGYGQSQQDVKNENHEGGQNGYYIPPTSLGANPDGTHSPPLWNLSPAHDDLLRTKSQRLIDFCFPTQGSLQEPPNNRNLRDCLTPDAIKHFLSLYFNFQGHFPWLHIPTFKFLEAYDGLLLAVVCGGAVYSDRVTPAEVRALLSLVKLGIERTARILKYIDNYDQYEITASGFEIEEMYSLQLLCSLMIWHGGPEEREAARNDMKRLSGLAQRYGLERLASPDQPEAFSYLHTLAPGQPANVSRWDWFPWIEQEKRLRLMYLMYVTDFALCLYFNMAPSFQPTKITLPLPSDDAAWDAPDGESCAQALGVRGAELQSRVNVSGSLRLKSLEFDQAMRALHDPSIDIRPRTTNVYSKFILIHALHAEIWQLQRQRSLEGPQSHEDSYHSIISGLRKWKQSWDEDIALQYPQHHGVSAWPRKVGFCRDSIQFWYLAKALLQPNRMHDWHMPADSRLRLMMKGLNMAREWSLSDGARRGEEPGSVSLIDDSYASSERLILDMRKLFRPLGDFQQSG